MKSQLEFDMLDVLHFFIFPEKQSASNPLTKIPGVLFLLSCIIFIVLYYFCLLFHTGQTVHWLYPVVFVSIPVFSCPQSFSCTSLSRKIFKIILHCALRQIEMVEFRYSQTRTIRMHKSLNSTSSYFAENIRQILIVVL